MSCLTLSVGDGLGFNTSSIVSTNVTGTGDSLFYKDTMTCYDWWQNWYYPYIIKESYPVYIQERAKDKGKQAYEIIKQLKDKKLIEIKSVKQFMEIMDELIKVL